MGSPHPGLDSSTVDAAFLTGMPFSASGVTRKGGGLATILMPPAFFLGGWFLLAFLLDSLISPFPLHMMGRRWKQGRGFSCSYGYFPMRGKDGE